MKRCLIVDSSDVVRKVAGTILAAKGYEIVEAANGRDGLELARSTSPDAILLDWKTPEVEAHELIAKVRAQKTGPRAHIVYMATEYERSDITRALAAGADACLMKPFDRATLEDRFQMSRFAA